MLRFIAALCAISALSLRAAPPPVGGAAEIDRLIAQAIGAAPAAPIADYANAVGSAPESFESFVEAARRILAGGQASRQPPDITALQLERSAAALLAARDATSLHVSAHLARFHARRIIAAVHYNLFKRGLRLAELLAAAAREKEAVAAWRDLVSAADRARHPSASAFRADLKRLEAGLKELEEQCCPSDEGVLKEAVWQPARSL